MTYDFFNTSYLAFGSKLTRAFRSLADKLDNSYVNVELLQQQLTYYDQYINRNYKVPTPSGGGSPVQAKQIYDILKVKQCIIRDLSYADGKLHVAVSYISNGNKITYASGETELTKGYCYIKTALTNDAPSTELTFVEEEDEGKNLLFSFEIQSDKVRLSDLDDTFPLFCGSYDNHYKTMTWTEVDSSDYLNQEITHDTYLIAIVKGSGRLEVSIDNKVIWGVNCPTYLKYSIPLYLKPGETFTGATNLEHLFRIDLEAGRSV